MNPWLTIPLDDYESHMSHDEVRQDALLAETLGNSATRLKPASVCIVGCAGGNGLQLIDAGCTVCGIDINPGYVDAARTRYERRFKQAHFLVHDIESGPVPTGSYELVYCGLILEYVDMKRAMPNLVTLSAVGGRLVVVLQGSSAHQPRVSKTPFESLKRLDPIMRLIEPAAVIECFEKHGCRLENSSDLHSVSGKRFHMLEFSKPADMSATGANPAVVVE